VQLSSSPQQNNSSAVQLQILYNSSGDEIANVNFLYDDIVHILQNTIDSCINSATIDAVMCWKARLPNSVK